MSEINGRRSPGREKSTRSVVSGTISSVAFETGDRFVIGHWPLSPLGPMSDVMWTKPSGHRTLMTTTAAVADFIAAIYEFDEVRLVPVSVDGGRRHTSVSSPAIEIDVTGGRQRPMPFGRPLVVTRIIEAPIARALMGVRTYGISPTGCREWYQSSGWSWVTSARAVVEGRDLGSHQLFDAPMGVGFSEPPKRPSIVAMRVTIDFPPSSTWRGWIVSQDVMRTSS